MSAITTPAMGSFPFRVTNRNGKLEDTIGEILRAIRDKSGQVAGLALKLYHPDVMEASRRVHAWTVANVRYRLDPERTELVRTPGASIADRLFGIDCEDYTILMASLLKEMGHAQRLFLTIVDLSPTPGYEHIYLSVLPEGTPTQNTIHGGKPQGVAVDMLLPYGAHPPSIVKSMQISVLGSLSHRPVLGNLGSLSPKDSRKAEWLRLSDPGARPFVAAILKYVDDVRKNGDIVWKPGAPLDRINNVLNRAYDGGEMIPGAARSDSELGSLGLFKKKKDKDAPGGTFGRGLARVSPILIAGRGAFIGLVRLNALKLASKMRLMYLDEATAKKAGMNMAAWKKAAAAKARLEKTWLDLGGDLKNLKEAISKGSGVPTSRLAGEPVTTTGAMVAAAPVLTAVGVVLAQVDWKVLKTEKGEPLSNEDIAAAAQGFVNAASTVVKAAKGGGGAAPGGTSQVETGSQNRDTDDDDDDDDSGRKDNTWLWVLLGLGVAGAGTAVFMATQKRNGK